MRLILASASPRRADLLAAAGYTFDIQPAQVDERVLPGEDPEAHVLRLASAKAAAVAAGIPGAMALGADTVVVIDDEILGKPADASDAARMLRLLSGRWHEVLTGVALRIDSRETTGVECSRVRFAKLDEAEIAWYMASGEPMDKAGAYGIQGLASRFIERVEGSCSNVVGLPVRLVHLLLKGFEGR